VVITRETDGRVLYGNSLVAEMFEIPRDELTSKFAADFYVRREDRDQAVERLRALGALRDVEVEMRTMSGRPFWASYSAQSVTFEEQPALLAGILDISARKHAEEALRTSEELYRVLFEASPFPAWAFDIETLAFLAVNDATVRHYGYSRQEFMRMTVRDLHPPGDADFPEERPAASGRASGRDTHQVRHRRKDGSILEVEATARSVVFRGRPARIVTINDVTERLRLQEQLQHAQKLESIGRLAGGVAHDFNNLLTAILGYTQILETRMTGDPPALQDLSEIRRAGTRARDLTQQLLAVARRQVTAPRIVDLNALVSELERLLQRLVAEDVVLVTRLGRELWPVTADPAQIEQVLMNLAVNGRDAMPEGGRLTIETENLRVDASSSRRRSGMEPGDYVVLRVSDTGVGMSEEVLGHVFEPFFTTKPVGQGTGLGLATVYGTVRQSGGHIWVESAPGHGTTFSACFPRATGAVESMPGDASGVARGGRESVLLVEDDEAVRALAARVLQAAGYAVRVASGGTEALDLVAGDSSAIDLLVTDVVMPYVSGKEVAERVSRTRPGLTVLYISGYPQGPDDASGVLKPGDAFLPKPFTGPQLLFKVREVLDRRSRA
jgi:hypothetical protein